MMEDLNQLQGEFLSQFLFVSTIFIFVALLILIPIYIYISFAYMTIAKKAKLKSPALAWIPAVGPFIIAFQTSKMHWWPWLFLILALLPVLGNLFGYAFLIATIFWEWKMFEKIKKPGWWALLNKIPVVNLIIIGIAAWSD